MSDAFDRERRPRRRPRWWVLLTGLGVLVLVFATLWSWLLYQGMRKVPAVAGGVTIDVEPGVRIFAGDRLLGPGTTFVEWSTLLSQEGQVFVLPLELPAGSPTAEQLAGPGTKVLQRNPSGGTGTNVVQFTFEEWYLRRADGSLDQIFAVVLDWSGTDATGRRRLLLPLRLRAAAGQPAAYIGPAGHGITGFRDMPQFVRVFGKSPRSCNASWTFRVQPSTNPFAIECQTKGVWEPAEMP
jgi:hypothetical protein